jgi:hypothetical protein
VLAEAAAVAAVVARKVDTPDTYPAEAAAQLVAAVAEVHYAQAWEAAAASTSSSGSRATCAAFVGLDRASAAAAVAAAVARRPHTLRQLTARRWSACCRWVIRSLLCRVLEGCLSLVCGCCLGGFGLESRRRVEARRTTPQQLVEVWVFDRQLRAGEVVADLGCLQE